MTNTTQHKLSRQILETGEVEVYVLPTSKFTKPKTIPDTFDRNDGYILQLLNYLGYIGLITDPLVCLVIKSGNMAVAVEYDNTYAGCRLHEMLDPMELQPHCIYGFRICKPRNLALFALQEHHHAIQKMSSLFKQYVREFTFADLGAVIQGKPTLSVTHSSTGYRDNELSSFGVSHYIGLDGRKIAMPKHFYLHYEIIPKDETKKVKAPEVMGSTDFVVFILNAQTHVMYSYSNERWFVNERHISKFG